MAIQLQLRRGSTVQHSTFTGAEGEVTIDTDLQTIRVHDGSTPGGFPLVGGGSVFTILQYESGTITGTTLTSLDSFDATEFRTAKYIAQIKDGTSVHSSEIMLTHDGTDAYILEYGIVTSDGELGEFTATLATGTVTLKFTPTGATSMVIKLIRMSLTA